MDFLVSNQLAERVFAILVTESDDDGYVSASGEGAGKRAGVSRASGTRALAFLAARGDIELVRRGSRTAGPSLYRVQREVDTDLLRTAPTVA